MFRKLPVTHIILFLLTFITTVVAGAINSGIDPISEPHRIYEGMPFALTLITILLVHEFSHYLASKIHRTEATLPYFIPAPSIIGTFGAFIKMKSPINTREALIDIGASGPLAGFFISVIACIAGLSMSEIVKLDSSENSFGLGSSILFSIMTKIIIGNFPDNHDILLHPIAFAGWIGLFVTSMNLIPIGQLDGGHIAYAIFGERQKLVSKLLVALLMILGIFLWQGWIIWAVLMIIMGTKHPPVLYWHEPVSRSRTSVAIISLIVLILTFVPMPFKIEL
ncbi:MAG: site-2 protease family protein [Dissulfurispiraceae bacterium]|jgi:membrane-associated protease RseP (regulator of RpoE activity)|nr:site-2 protease family protein [Dissulfurispiraceae bacterium]